MVTFTCDLCQESLRKAFVDRHCETKCRNAWTFTCVDCNKTFEGFAYKDHNSCISGTFGTVRYSVVDWDIQLFIGT